jgi:hypothetical protein
VTPGATASATNSTPPPPELRPIFIELAFCLRYFIAYTNAGMGLTATQYWPVGVTAFPVVMRATPTASNMSFTASSGNNGTPGVSNFTNQITQYGVMFENTAGNWSSTFAAAFVYFSAQFSAEL